MKKLLEVTEVPGEGLVSLLGQQVILLCQNYFYAGKLVGVNDSDVLLQDALIVYETGEWSSSTWKDAQKLPFPLYVRTQAIEAYGVAGK